MWIIPLAASVISALCCGVLLRNYFRSGRQAAHLAWAAALFVFAVAGCCAFLGSVSGWTSLIAKTYYLAAGVLPLGLIALGTLYLLAPRSAARIWLGVVAAGGLLGAVLIATAGVDVSALRSATGAGWLAIDKPALLTVAANLVNSAATLIIIAGAAYGVALRRHAPGALLIAAGALITGISGMLTGLGRYEYQSLGQALAAILLFAGFLKTMEPAGSRLSRAARQPA